MPADFNPPLLIAEAANPDWTSVPLEGWSHSTALHRLTGGHIATQIRNREAISRTSVDPSTFTFIDSEALARPAYAVAEFLRGGANRGWTTVTAIQAVTYPYFEHQIWRQFADALRAGRFSLVHRLTPLSPTMPSLLARKVRRLGLPFVIGPLNGGVPWPAAFDSARRREKEWLSYVRDLHTLLPGWRSTRKHASAIICGSRDTLAQMPDWCQDRCVYIPENAIDPARFPEPLPRPSPAPLRVAFVGRLVPYKCADVLIEAAAPLIRQGAVHLELLGSGPEEQPLRDLAARMDLSSGIHFHGWVPHTKVSSVLQSCHVFGFPSIREFGGAVALEAMASGLVPIVVKYGGPGELVTPQTGFLLPLSTRSELVVHLRDTLQRLADDPSGLPAKSALARRRVLDHFTWDAKAAQVLEVYRWVLGLGPKPAFPQFRDSAR